MNWSIKGRSGSFKSTLGYVQHDKDADTAERVGEVEFLNVGSDDTWREMKATAEAAPELKRRAGIANPNMRTDKPVLHYTLSWHPDDKPTPEHMMLQAKVTLGLLGLQDHQAVVVEHKDRPHPHLHVVVNMVNPETGRVATLSHHALKLDRWAHEYEESQGMRRSFKRSAKHDRQQTKTGVPVGGRDVADRLNKRAAKIKKEQAHVVAEQREEHDQVWTDYRNARRQILRRYTAAIGTPKTPALEMKAPRQPKPREWQALAKAMKAVGHLPDRINHKKDSAPLVEKAGELRADFPKAPAGHPAPILNKRLRTEKAAASRDAALSALAKAHAEKLSSLEKAQKGTARQHASQWADFKKEQDAAWAGWRRENGMPELDKASRYKQAAERAASIKPGFAKEAAAPGPAAPKERPLDLKTFADDYISGKARDSLEHLQFAVNHPKEIEEEFARRKAAEPVREQPAAKSARDRPADRPRYNVQITERDAQAQFSEAIRAAGIDLKGRAPVMDGKKHYAPLIDQKRGKSGAYCGYLDAHPAGWIKNYKTDEYQAWRANGPKREMSPAERERHETDVRERRATREIERQDTRVRVQRSAEEMIGRASPADPNHPYLVIKGIEPHGILQDDRGNLIMPLYDTTGALRSAQTIDLTGEKVILKGTEKEGLFHLIGEIKEQEKVVVVEGFATGAAVREETGHTVAVAIDAHNVPHVAAAIRGAHPDQPMAIAADNDKHLTERGLKNTGLDNAEKAARENNAELLVPDFGDKSGKDCTDFNDFRREFGEEATQFALSSPALTREEQEQAKTVEHHAQEALVPANDDSWANYQGMDGAWEPEIDDGMGM